MYGVAMISRLLTIIGLFCKRALYKRLYSAKETYNLKGPTNYSHPISVHGKRLAKKIYNKNPNKTLLCLSLPCVTFQKEMNTYAQRLTHMHRNQHT